MAWNSLILSLNRQYLGMCGGNKYGAICLTLALFARDGHFGIK